MGCCMSPSAKRGFDAIQGYFSRDVSDFRSPGDYPPNVVEALLKDLVCYCDEYGVDFDGAVSRVRVGVGRCVGDDEVTGF